MLNSILNVIMLVLSIVAIFLSFYAITSSHQTTKLVKMTREKVEEIYSTVAGREGFINADLTCFKTFEVL